MAGTIGTAARAAKRVGRRARDLRRAGREVTVSGDRHGRHGGEAMRTGELALGIVAGGCLGFLLHAWLAGAGAERDHEPPGRAPATSREAPRPLVAADAEPGVAAPLAPTPTAAAGPASDDGRVPAADALVGILLHGALVQPDGSPVPVDPQRNWMHFDDGRGKPRSTQVSPASTYSVSGLRPGPLTLRANPPGFRPCVRTLQLDAARPVVRHDLVIEPAPVLVIKGFTPEGEPLLDAVLRELGGERRWQAPRLSAIATREPPVGDLPPISHRNYERWELGHYADRLDASWNGTGDLPSDAMGRLELDEPLPACVSLVLRHVLLATQRVEPGTTEVVFVVPLERLRALLGALRLRVVDAGTRAVPEGVRAELSDSQSSGGGQPPGADGAFAWDAVAPGLSELAVHAPGLESHYQEVLVPPGGVAELGTLELSPAVSISGFAVDEAGQPAVVSLRALRDDLDAGLGMGARIYRKSDAEGAFRFEGLGRHRYRVVVGGEDFAADSVAVDARGGDVAGVRVVVRRGALLRLVTDWPASETYGLRVTSADGSRVSDVEAWPGDWTWSKRLGPGDYVATLSRDGRELRRVDFRVGDEDLSVRVAP